jgi:ferredoxin-type protein NapG
VQAISLADINEGVGMGVPFIEARAQACDFSCNALQCILACPTGSLSHAVKKKEEVRMGLARVANPGTCLATKGQGVYDLELCNLCEHKCPIDNAISLEPIGKTGNKMPVIHEACVGCGVCEMICPVEPAVIVIDERKVW